MTTSWAMTVSFTKPCLSDISTSFYHPEKENLSVGQITLKALEELKIPYIGSEDGINSIFKSPVGLDAIEIISDREMYAYGWCYSVNGVEPEILPGRYGVRPGDEIVWWYGYAHYKDGRWISQCELSSFREDSDFCKGVQKDFLK